MWGSQKREKKRNKDRFHTNGFPEESFTLSTFGSQLTLLSEPTITPGKSLKFAPCKGREKF